MGTRDERSALEKPESRIIPSLSPRGAKFREELLTKILLWQQITVSFDNFLYYIQEHTKSLLVECVASNLKHNELRKYSASLKSSSERILLQTIPGGELYRERLVSAVAREMKVPLLRLDLDHGCDDEIYPNHHLHLPRYNPSPDAYEYERDGKIFKKGDRVEYIGRNISFKEVNNRTLSRSQRGEVYEVKCNTIAVVFNVCGLKPNKEEENDEKNTQLHRQSIVVWLHVKDVRHDDEVRKHDCYIAMEVLYEVLESQQPLIVYIADSFLWPPLDKRNETFLRMVENIFDQLPEGVVMICPQNNWEAGLETEEVCKSGGLPFSQKGKFPKLLKKYLDRFPQGHSKSELHKLFSNVICIKPPKDEDLVDTFIQQIEEDRLTFISEANLRTMHKVLKDHNLSCMNLEHPVIEDMILKRKKVEKIVGWAINHYFSLGPLRCVNEETLHIPLDSIKLAISRFMEEENYTLRPKMKSKALQDLSHLVEGSLASAVVLSVDIGVKFDDVGVLENVKKVLYETVILPMKRPELFSHGNMPCKGILLFGPAGTGQTLVAKALATESGASFIHITAETIKSLSVGMLFANANKLAPLIIYFYEVDTFPGVRGHYDDDKLQKFMAAWDQWKSKESHRILLIGATNGPFDVDEAVIRQMPRRIYIGLPDLETRSKILKVVLNKRNLEPEFSFERVAEATEDYSGSDLKNLCSAAAYGPIQEFLKQESKGESSDGVPTLRPLTVNDFIQAKSKVRPSATLDASNTMKLREWKEQFGEGESQSLQI